MSQALISELLKLKAYCTLPEFQDVDYEVLARDTNASLFEGASEADIRDAILMAVRSKIEEDPAYSLLAGRLLNQWTNDAVTALGLYTLEETVLYGISAERLDPLLATFDLAYLNNLVEESRSHSMDMLAVSTLVDRYLQRDGQDRIFETIQRMLMRVAMGLAINEGADKNKRAAEFYAVLSSKDYMASTPTLFNAGTNHAQLSSCYLTTIPDDLDAIYEAYRENALLSKWAGGLGNDWTPVRAMGSRIKGTNGKSQGVVPFLNVQNASCVAVNQGGLRKGAACAYLETWHADIEEFLELRKNTGDDRRRAHDMNTANWVPDEFMRRVFADEDWYLMSPDEVGDLHDLYGKAFSERYAFYVNEGLAGRLATFRKVRATDLWRKMLSMLFETGHPWITFKDPCNIRSPQQHVGVVHSSNLCCIAADQRVVTDRGMLTIGELYALGGKNQVVGLDGVYQASEMLLPRPNAPMVKITTQEGYSHKVTPDHKVWVKDTGWVEAQHLQHGDKLLTQQLEGLWGEQHHPELAYLIGLTTGDGTFGGEQKDNVHLDVWQQDFQHLPAIEHAVHHVLDGNTVLRTTSTNQPCFNIDPIRGKARLTSMPLARLMAAHGFNKASKLQVPHVVWTGTRDTAAAYLKGLYQADGNIVASAGVSTMVFASTSLAFVEELQVLWANFGVKSSINKMRDTQMNVLPNGQGGVAEYKCQALYRLLITSIQGCKIAETVTGLAASKSSESAQQFLQNLQKDGYAQKLHATFTGLEILPNEDAFCLMVDSDTHAWTVNGVVTKNTEITLNTSAAETAVCNLGSINLVQHVTEDGQIDYKKLESTISLAIRMLDNVIDINYYPTDKAREANLAHRPIGLGVMGFQDALYKLGYAYGSNHAIRIASEFQEAIACYAIKASALLAAEKGRYSSYASSLWDRGIFPQDSDETLMEERHLDYVRSNLPEKDFWKETRALVAEHGMRNSNVMAIAPTATISNICGVSQSIEPTFQNLYVKSNLSGEFTVVNPYLVKALKYKGLWSKEMAQQLKLWDGSVQHIPEIPEYIKEQFKTAFELDMKHLITVNAGRQYWVDQAISLNIYLARPDGKLLDGIYKHAYEMGLKTTYYLRSKGATSTEKATVSDGQLNAVKKPNIPQACSIDNPDCEACQ